MDSPVIYNEGRLHARFQHESIDTSKGQIRLITLLKDLSPEGLVQCSVRVAQLSEELEYQAISYVWGPETPVRQITLNGSLYSIRENLWQFLNMFRLSCENDAPLWVDQISINQSDVIERSQQVQSMGTIFSCATQVVPWLGWPDPTHASIKVALASHEHDHDLDYAVRWEQCGVRRGADASRYFPLPVAS